MKPAWVQSEPPRGSGWVRSLSESVYDVPTRYREVVLTVSKQGAGNEILVGPERPVVGTGRLSN